MIVFRAGQKFTYIFIHNKYDCLWVMVDDKKCNLILDLTKISFLFI